jgi:hypothetical protein
MYEYYGHYGEKEDRLALLNGIFCLSTRRFGFRDVGLLLSKVKNGLVLGCALVISHLCPSCLHLEKRRHRKEITHMTQHTFCRLYQGKDPRNMGEASVEFIPLR